MQKAMLMLLLTAGCATTPEGTDELMQRLRTDYGEKQRAAREVSQGRTIFLKVQSYPSQLPDGDIWLGGDLLLNVGRENVSISGLVEQHQQKDQKKNEAGD